MATTDISIINTALLMVGANDINSLSDASAEAKLANSVYQDVKQSLLQYNPWRFSLKQKDLGGALTTDPLFDWRYSYQTPSDLLRVISIEGDAEYEVYEDKIFTDVSPCRIIYQSNVQEKDFPSYFIRCLNFHLASTFAVSLLDDAAKMQMFEQRADKETARARNIDAQQQPNSRISDVNYSLINVRG
jgi:hypothetical protein